jgi:Family of unknown function (DUF6328)
MAETEKERTDRQLLELLNELRVALPGAQVLLGFLLTVPFATRFGRVSHTERIALLVCLLSTVAGTILLMAPSVYHRLRWDQGGKSDVIRVAHRLFLAGTALLGVGIAASVFLVTSVVFGSATAVACTIAAAVMLLATWYVLPLSRGRLAQVRRRE